MSLRTLFEFNVSLFFPIVPKKAFRPEKREFRPGREKTVVRTRDEQLREDPDQQGSARGQEQCFFKCRVGREVPRVHLHL